MEVVGGVASVIAIVDLAGKVAKICTGYIKDAKSAASDISSLIARAEEMKSLLQELDDLLKGPHKEKLKTSSKLQSSLFDCKAELQGLVIRLEIPQPPNVAVPAVPTSKSGGLRNWLKSHSKSASSSNLVQALKWPLEKSDVEKTSQKLKAMSDAIRFAMEIDRTTLLIGLDEKVTLLNLPVAEGAAFGSFGDDREPQCLDHTRENLLQKIVDWADSPRSNVEPIFWLSGGAGTGKSTIARTIAKKFKDKGLLGASFFFRRGAGDCASASKFFPTLVSDLSLHIPDMRASVSSILDEDPNLPRKVLKEQFEKLFLQPLSETKSAQRSILVIDALDECDVDRDAVTIIKLLGEAMQLNSPDLRIFITSRKETFLNRGFEKLLGVVREKILHDMEEQEIQHDISLFFNHELEKIRLDWKLPTDWPLQSEIDILTRMASPLFIVAANICRLLEDPDFRPDKQLIELLKGEHSLVETNPERSLRSTYAYILQGRLRNKTNSQKAAFIAEFQEIIGTIVLLEIPLSRSSLSRLLDKDEDRIKCRTNGFQSVLHIPQDSEGLIKTLHLSFREFLLDNRIKETSASFFWLDERQVHKYIATRCIKLMRACLKKDICNTKFPGVLRSEILPDTIHAYIKPDLHYACRYWAHHIIKSGEEICDGGDVHEFLKDKVLEWLESTSLLDIYTESVYVINNLESLLSKTNAFELSNFLYEAKRFIRSSSQTSIMAPLQIYYSALLFSPENSLFRKLFLHRHNAWVQILPKVPADWDAHLQILDGHTEAIEFLSFNPDGKSIVSIDCYGVINTWDVISGTLKRNVNLPSALMHRAAFSPDGTTFALGFYNDIKVWNLDSEVQIAEFEQGNSEDKFGVEISTTKGAEHLVWDHFLKFSSDGLYLFAGVPSGDIQMWSTGSWELKKSFVGYLDGWLQLADFDISANGIYLASTDSRSSYKIYNISSGILEHRIPAKHPFGLGYKNIKRLLFSPNSKLLAFLERSSVMILQLISPDKEPGIIKTISVENGTDMAFMPDGRLIVSSRQFMEITIWGPDFNISQKIFPGRSFHLLAVSPGGGTLASAYSNVVHIWDMASLSTSVMDSCADLQLVSPVAWTKRSPNSAQIIATGYSEENHGVELWHITANGLVSLFHFKDHISCPYFGDFSPDGRFLMAWSRSANRDLTVWDTTSGETVIKYSNILEWERVSCATFSEDNSYLAITGQYGFTVILDFRSQSKTPVHTLYNGEGYGNIRFSSFSLDGKILFLFFPRGTELWSVETGNRILIIHGVHDFHSSKFGEIRTCVTDAGAISYRGDLTCLKHTFDYVDGWVVQKNRRILWIPSNFQPDPLQLPDDKWYFWEDKILFTHSGVLNFMKLDPDMEV